MRQEITFYTHLVVFICINKGWKIRVREMTSGEPPQDRLRPVMRQKGEHGARPCWDSLSSKGNTHDMPQAQRTRVYTGHPQSFSS